MYGNSNAPVCFSRMQVEFISAWSGRLWCTFGFYFLLALIILESKKRKRVQLIKPILFTYLVTRGRKYRNKMQVYFCNIFQAFSFKMTLQESNSHKESLHSMSLKLLAIKKLAKNERVTVLRHFYTVSFKLSVKNKTGKCQRLRDKTYKVVNLISRRASIISMDIYPQHGLSLISTHGYIHGYIHGFIHGYPYPRQAWY